MEMPLGIEDQGKDDSGIAENLTDEDLIDIYMEKEI